MYASYTHIGYPGGRPGTVGACQRHHWRVPLIWGYSLEGDGVEGGVGVGGGRG